MPRRRKPPYPVVQGKYYKFEKIADGVYYATAEYNGTAFPFGSNPFFGANLVVIVNDNDVVLVDTGTSPRCGPRLGGGHQAPDGQADPHCRQHPLAL